MWNALKRDPPNAVASSQSFDSFNFPLIAMMR